MKWFFAFLFLFSALQGEEVVLRNNLQKAKPGDYLVITANKTLTLMHIFDKKENLLTIEEISVPESKQPANWKQWVEQRAPGNTSWVMYEIDLSNGQMARYFSFTKNQEYNISDADNFLTKLLNLKFTKLADYERKRVGPKPGGGPDMRPFWQPRMVVNGQTVDGVVFEAWKTSWPRDGSELSNKTIEVFLPQNSETYPSYFPYWLQIVGAVGKAKIRIIDSGSGLKSYRHL